MKLRFDRAMAVRLDFASAARAEAEQTETLLPSRCAESGVLRHVDEYGNWVRNQVIKGVNIRAADVIWASKDTNLSRPLAAVGMRDRVLYRALADEICREAGITQRASQTYIDAERAVLTAGECSFVVVADVASFYDSVDHDDLTDRVVSTTGRADTAEALEVFLGSVMGRRVGLPQVLSGSDDLSELVISSTESAMRRAGWSTYRYNDDFWTGVRDRESGRASVERLQLELRKLGLVLNEHKTRILDRQSFEDGIGAVGRAVDEAVVEASADLVEVDSYTGQIVQVPTESQAFIDGADQLLQQAVPSGDIEDLDPIDRYRDRRLVRYTLATLRAVGATNALPYLCMIVAAFPDLARDCGQYLRQMPAEESAKAVETFARAQDSLQEWQAMWIWEGLLSEGAKPSVRTIRWLRQVASTASFAPTTRSRAILALAVHGQVTEQDVARLANQVPGHSMPDLYAAAALVAPKRARIEEAGVEITRLGDWIVEDLLANRDLKWI
jgi:hypothetical protein